MQKFTFRRSQLDGRMEPAEDPGTEFYLVSDVDARIAELERQIREMIECPACGDQCDQHRALMESKA